MKEYSAREGPYSLRLHYEVAEIDVICRDALKSCGLFPKEPAPVDIERFLEKYFGVRIVYEDLGESVLGCTVFAKNGAVTGFLISSEIEAQGTKSSERRARSTIAHEGGHGLLHPKLFIENQTGNLFGNHTDGPKPMKFMCRASDIGPAGAAVPSYNGQWWEWQANRAIGGLLLPKNLVRTAVADFLLDGQFGSSMNESKRSEAEKLVAETFDVNPAVSRIRLQEMFPQPGQRHLA